MSNNAKGETENAIRKTLRPPPVPLEQLGSITWPLRREVLSDKLRADTKAAIKVRRRCMADLPLVARLHQRAFPHVLWTSLTPELATKYFAWQTRQARDWIALGAWVENKLVGYCRRCDYAESSIYLIKPGLRNALAFWPMMAIQLPVIAGRKLSAALGWRPLYDRSLHRLSKVFRRKR
jgi:hypothetical protein